MPCDMLSDFKLSKQAIYLGSHLTFWQKKNLKNEKKTLVEKSNRTETNRKTPAKKTRL